MMKMWHLLVVEDEPDIARVLERGRGKKWGDGTEPPRGTT